MLARLKDYHDDEFGNNDYHGGSSRGPYLFNFYTHEFKFIFYTGNANEPSGFKFKENTKKV